MFCKTSGFFFCLRRRSFLPAGGSRREENPFSEDPACVSAHRLICGALAAAAAATAGSSCSSDAYGRVSTCSSSEIKIIQTCLGRPSGNRKHWLSCLQL